MNRTMTLQFIALCMLALLLPVSVLAQETERVLAFELRWSPDGRWIGVSSNNGIWIFDAEDFDAEPLHYAEGTVAYVAAFDPLRPYVAFAPGDSEQVHVIEIETSEEVFTAAAPKDEDAFGSVFYDLGYSDDGQYLSIVNGPLLYIIEAETGERVRLAAYPQASNDSGDWLTSLDYMNSMDAVLVSDWRGRLIALEIENDARPEFHQVGDQYTTYRVEAIPETEQFLVHMANSLHIFDLEAGELELLIDGEDLPVKGFDLSPDGEFMAVGSANRWLLYNLAENSIISEFEVEIDPETSMWDHVHSLAFNPDGDRVATLQGDGQVIIWDVTTGEIVAELGAFSAGINQRWG